jgi:hypothetical protein
MGQCRGGGGGEEEAAGQAAWRVGRVVARGEAQVE